MKTKEERVAELTQHIEQDLRAHELHVLVDSGKYKIYELRKPGTIINLVEFFFTPYGMSIQGDLTPADNEPCGSRQTLQWFLGDFGSGYDYIMSKFPGLNSWCEDAARDRIRNLLEDFETKLQEMAVPERRRMYDDTHAAMLESFELGQGFDSPDNYLSTYTTLHDADPDEFFPSAQPDTRATAVMLAIRNTFRRLWELKFPRITEKAG